MLRVRVGGKGEWGERGCELGGREVAQCFFICTKSTKLFNTYHDDITNLGIHGNPTGLEGNAKHSKRDSPFAALALTAAVAMATNAVTMCTCSTKLPKYIAMVTTVVDTRSRRSWCFQHLWLKKNFNLYTWIVVLEDCGNKKVANN